MQDHLTTSDHGEYGEYEDAHRLILLDISELIKRAQTSIAFIKLVIIRETLKDQACAQHIQVLDDVTPLYEAVAQSLANCKLTLCCTLEAMLQCEVRKDRDAGDRHLEPAKAAK